MAVRTPLIVGNWKMHGRRADIEEIAALWRAISLAGETLETVICPPAAYVEAATAAAAAGAIRIGAQDCSTELGDAARTGEISAAMLADLGARYVIVGHSERRIFHHEGDDLVRAKAEAALAAGLTPIVCVGETRAERDSGQAGEIVAAQVQRSFPTAAAEAVVAYEPVWAIGGNRTPTGDEIAEMHALIRQSLSQISEHAAEARILYGGSVGPKNAGEIFATPGVDGALVGRASLKATDFAAIVLAHPAAAAGMR